MMKLVVGGMGDAESDDAGASHDVEGSDDGVHFFGEPT